VRFGRCCFNAWKTSNAEKAGGAAVADGGSTFMTSGAIALPDGGIDIAAAGFGIEGGRITSNAWVRIVVPDCMAGFNDCCIGNRTFMTSGAVAESDGGIDTAAAAAEVPD
jgi:hypothetical protein